MTLIKILSLVHVAVQDVPELTSYHSQLQNCPLFSQPCDRSQFLTLLVSCSIYKTEGDNICPAVS